MSWCYITKEGFGCGCSFVTDNEQRLSRFLPYASFSFHCTKLLSFLGQNLLTHKLGSKAITHRDLNLGQASPARTEPDFKAQSHLQMPGHCGPEQDRPDPSVGQSLVRKAESTQTRLTFGFPPGCPIWHRALSVELPEGNIPAPYL